MSEKSIITDLEFLWQGTQKRAKKGGYKRGIGLFVKWNG